MREFRSTKIWSNDDIIFQSRKMNLLKSPLPPPQKPLNAFQQIIADFTNPQDICGALRPLLLLSFLAGISPFRIEGIPGHRHLRVTLLGILNTVAHIVIFCMAYAARLSNDESLVTYFFHSKVPRFGEDVQLLTSFVALALTLLSAFLKRNRLRQLIRVLNKVDSKLIRLGAIINYKILSRVVLFTIVVHTFLYSMFIVFTSTFVHALKDKPSIFEWIFFFMPIGITTTLKVQFYCILRVLAFRLRYICFILHGRRQRTNASEPDDSDDCTEYNIFCIKRKKMELNGVGVTNREDYDVIRELCRTHGEMCDAAKLAEDYFGYQMLTIVTIEFIYAIFNVYYMVEVIYHSNTTITEIGTFQFVSFFVYHTVISMGTVYALLRSARMVTAENEMCAVQVHKLMNGFGRHEIEIKELLTQFSMQLFHRKIKFTASGLFPLDNTLIFTMTGAATTYLIILFQMGNALN